MLLEVMDMSIILAMVIVAQVITYAHTHQTVYFKYVQFLAYPLYLSKAVSQKKEELTRTKAPHNS